MTLDLARIRAAQERIAPYIIETPLMRLPNLDKVLGCTVYAKAECLQVTGAFKFRGAMNKVLTLSPEDLAKGVIAASSGNHGKGLSYVAKMLGAKATIVMPYTAPKVKVEAIKSLGAEVIQCETVERFAVAEKVCRERGATMVPPFNDEDIMAGQGTIGLEILKQEPALDAVIVPVSGGGLIGGIATAVKSVDPRVKIYGAEPANLPRYSASLKAGCPTEVPAAKTVCDALVSNHPGDVCFPYVQKYTDGFADVEDEWLPKAQKLLLMEGKLLAEISSSIGIAAVLQGALKFKPEDKVCFIISGGSIGFDQLMKLEEVEL